MYRVSRSVLLGLSIAAAVFAHMATMLPHMPARVATSFSFDGTPHAWMTHNEFIGFSVAMLGLFWFAFFIAPRWLHKFPNAIDVPNRQYWMSPERRGQTLREIRAKMQELGCAMLAFLGLMNHSIFQANLSSPVNLAGSSFFVGLGVFLLFVLWWTTRFLRRFRYR